MRERIIGPCSSRTRNVGPATTRWVQSLPPAANAQRATAANTRSHAVRLRILAVITVPSPERSVTGNDQLPECPAPHAEPYGSSPPCRMLGDGNPPDRYNAPLVTDGGQSNEEIRLLDLLDRRQPTTRTQPL